MPDPKLTIYVDASSLKSDSLCDRRYLNHIIRGYTREKQVANYKAAYGTAFHVFLQNYYGLEAKDRQNPQTLDGLIDLAVEKYRPSVPYINDLDFRTVEHLRKSTKAYSDRYAIGDSLIPLKFKLEDQEEQSTLESKFCIPWHEDSDLIVYLVGTIDMPATYFGRPVIVDHKSSGTSPAKIKEFFSEFRMNIQTQLYVWVWKYLSKMDEYLPILVNGIFIKKPTQKVEKEGYFDGVQFKRSDLIEYGKEEMWQFELWLEWRLKHIIELAKAYQRELLTYNDIGAPSYAACHGRYGTCQFYSICQLPPSSQVAYLKNNYIVEPYNPLTWHD